MENRALQGEVREQIGAAPTPQLRRARTWNIIGGAGLVLLFAVGAWAFSSLQRRGSSAPDSDAGSLALYALGLVAAFALLCVAVFSLCYVAARGWYSGLKDS